MNSRTLHLAPVIQDAHAAHRPGALLLQGQTILARGTPESIGHIDGPVINHPGHTLIPALVNAHAHLDLSAIGPRTRGPETDFAAWISMVRAERPADERAIRLALERGVQLLKSGGVAAVGDIAGMRSLVPMDVLASQGIRGISYIECFGIGRGRAATLQWLANHVASMPRAQGTMCLGLQPHAPYSCSLDVYLAAAALQLPLSTHLAETREEIEFTRTAGGPLAEALRNFGVWDDSIAATHRHPIELLEPLLASTPLVAAHVNYASDEHLEILARSPITVAYCPRASEYFGHPEGSEPPHRYRDMLDRGIPVALGTDSLICLDTPDRISTLDEMRRLHRRDGTSPRRLLEMATLHGARALRLDPNLFTFNPGPVAGVLAVEGEDDTAAFLRSDSAPEWVVWGSS